MAHVV